LVSIITDFEYIGFRPFWSFFMKIILLACLCGGLGAVLRWWMSARLGKGANGFARGTLAVNFLGSFIAGIIICPELQLSAAVQTAAVTGFCGGLTTFSTFSSDCVSAFLRRQLSSGFSMIALQAAGCPALVWAGMEAGRMVG
jgi:CrcB protein